MSRQVEREQAAARARREAALQWPKFARAEATRRYEPIQGSAMLAAILFGGLGLICGQDGMPALQWAYLSVAAVAAAVAGIVTVLRMRAVRKPYEGMPQ